MTDLLPCPFCGGEAETVSLFPNDPHPGNTFVKCTSCKCTTRRGHITTAIAAWNTRPGVTVAEAAKVLLDWWNQEQPTDARKIVAVVQAIHHQKTEFDKFNEAMRALTGEPS